MKNNVCLRFILLVSYVFFPTLLCANNESPFFNWFSQKAWYNFDKINCPKDQSVCSEKSSHLINDSSIRLINDNEKLNEYFFLKWAAEEEIKIINSKLNSCGCKRNMPNQIVSFSSLTIHDYTQRANYF